MILQKLGHTSGSELTFALIFTALITSFIMAYLVSFVYRKTHTGFSYEASFNFTIILVTVIVTIIMMVIGSNIALSLGLIGSLSIIRFRAVIKDSKDMAYLFWAIATGLSVGSGNYLMAASSVFFVSVIVIVLSKMNFSQATHTDYIMVVQSSLDQSDGKNANMITNILDQCEVKWNVRSSLVDRNNLYAETTYSIIFKKISTTIPSALVDNISDLENIKKVTMLSPETNLFA
jgi:uncharacterized membrane protein YhiD involved in acid resistance